MAAPARTPRSAPSGHRSTRAGLTDPDAAAEVIENAIGRSGRLDALVNNAAAVIWTPLPGFDVGRALAVGQSGRR
jgi:NAD(P)-dependent dehydrogenase (short-subunit alcohol dehydrogenase family)